MRISLGSSTSWQPSFLTLSLFLSFIIHLRTARSDVQLYERCRLILTLARVLFIFLTYPLRIKK